VNNGIEMIWKETVVTYFKVLSQHLLQGPREATKHVSQDSRSPERYSNRGPNEYEVVPTVRQLRSAFYVVVATALKDEIGGTCGTHSRRYIHIKFYLRNLKGTI
jgi:hypothetical protein